MRLAELQAIQVVDRLAQVLPNAEVITVSGAGHPIQAQKLKEYTEAITAFSRRHTQ